MREHLPGPGSEYKSEVRLGLTVNAGRKLVLLGSQKTMARKPETITDERRSLQPVPRTDPELLKYGARGEGTPLAEPLLVQ